MTRMHFTRWERDRLGKLCLVRDSYEVIGEPQQSRQRSSWEYAAGFLVSSCVVVVVALVLLGAS